MTSYSHFINKDRLPVLKEIKQLSIFGIFNTTLYLGIFIVALQYVAAGITTMAIALNPLLISLMSSIGMRRRITLKEWLSISIGIVGIGIATYPLLQTSQVTLTGLVLLGLSMATYSFGSVYYASVKWELQRLSINGWQVLIGGIVLIPFTLLMYKGQNSFDLQFWLSTFWLIVPVSFGAVQLWLILLKTDAVRASLWLYLCPIFGFAFATIILGEPFTIYTIIGGILVLLALYIGQKRN